MIIRAALPSGDKSSASLPGCGPWGRLAGKVQTIESRRAPPSHKPGVSRSTVIFAIVDLLGKA
jgi:hypothetical protein